MGTDRVSAHGSPVAGLTSVVIPCFNQQRYIREAVESAVGQDYQPIEVVVVDDGSPAPIAPWLANCPVSLVRQPNAGVSAARNRGLAETHGEFVVFLDADDRLLRNAVNAGVRRLRDAPGAACAVGLCRVIDGEGRPAPFRQRGPLSADPYLELLRENFIWMPGQVVFRRATIAGVPFDSSVDACADYDLYLRVARKHPVLVHDEVVAEYRQHPESMSENGPLMLRLSLDVLGRQRDYLATPERRAAWRQGRRFWRAFYGDRVVEEVRAGLRTPGRRWRALEAAISLLRHHPIGAARQLLKKARLIAAGRTPASLGERSS
jgi:glycosyltransferase involved in cell wall biosynthesis